MKYSKEENFFQIQEKIRKQKQRRNYIKISIIISCFLLFPFIFSFQKEVLDTPDKIIWNEGKNRNSYTIDVCVRPREMNFFEEFDWFSNITIPENILSMSYFLDCMKDTPLNPNHYELYATSKNTNLTIAFGEKNRGNINTWCFGGSNLKFPKERASRIHGTDVYLEHYKENDRDYYYANLFAHGLWFNIYGEGYEEEDFLNLILSILK